jgi:hypothetical protein
MLSDALLWTLPPPPAAAAAAVGAGPLVLLLEAARSPLEAAAYGHAPLLLVLLPPDLHSKGSSRALGTALDTHKTLLLINTAHAAASVSTQAAAMTSAAQLQLSLEKQANCCEAHTASVAAAAYLALIFASRLPPCVLSAVRLTLFCRYSRLFWTPAGQACNRFGVSTGLHSLL